MTETYGTIQQLTKEFHEIFNHEVNTTPTIVPITTAINRSKWTAEELLEFIAASSKSREEFAKAYYQFVKGLEQVYKKLLGGEFDLTDKERLVAQNDAIGDVAYFVGGTANVMGTNLDQVVTIIHDSNLSKLFTDEDGNRYPKYREGDGKVMKSPEFQPPESRIEAYITSKI